MSNRYLVAFGFVFLSFWLAGSPLNTSPAQNSATPAFDLAIFNGQIVNDGGLRDGNEKTISEGATYDQLHQYPTGTELLAVHRHLVFEKGQTIDARPGVTLRSSSYASEDGAKLFTKSSGLGKLGTI